MDRVFINDLKVCGIIGVHDEERKFEQDIIINVDLYVDQPATDALLDDLSECVDYQQVADQISAHVGIANRFTVEALAADIARIVLADARVRRVRVKVEKPEALKSCRSVGVEIERNNDVLG